MNAAGKKTIFLGLVWLLWLSANAFAQEAQPTPEQLQQEQTEREKKALALLDRVISEAQSLRLPENRIRVQVNAGDLLWPRDADRARSLFNEAATSLTDLMQSADFSERRGFEQIRSLTQLRQELVTTTARHDPQLALDFMRATRLPDGVQDRPGPPGGPGSFAETNLEAGLLAQIAAADPALALKNANEMLDKEQYPNSLQRVLSQLQQKDKESATKLTDNLLRKLSAETLLSSRDAGSLTLSLLRAGPQPPEAAAKQQQPATTTNSNQVLNQADYVKLMESAISASLRAQPRTAGAGPGQNPRRGGPGGPGAQPQQLSEQEIAQNNARNLLSGLQTLLPQLQQYLPGRVAQVQQKLTETGQGNNNRQAFAQYGPLMRDGTTDSLIEAAAAAPPMMQSVLYQQAAIKAVNEGNAERAKQIASEHLDERQRTSVQMAIDRQQLSRTAATGNLEQMRQALSRLGTNEERIDMLIQMAAAAAQQNKPQQAQALLEEARGFVAMRAENYQQLDSRSSVARAWADIDPARGIEMLETGIEQLNELLPAAALLSGFELRLFRDGELPMQGGSGLSRVIMTYGQVLATLAQKDFERAETAADRFQRPEPRVFTRLSIVQGMLGGQDNAVVAGQNNNFNLRGRGGRQP